MKTFISIGAALGLALAPVAAAGASRASQSASDSSELASGANVLFLAGIAVVAAAIVLLPQEDDSPVSP